MQLSRDALLKAYRQMKTIRAFENRLHDEIALGEIAGFTHLYAGQEACAVGVCEHLGPKDYIISTHRGHGHCIAKGCDVVDMMKELYGSREGLCKGRGGSMHIADVNVGMLGANGIVGAGAPIAVGAGISAKATGHVSIAFSGDGACNQGTTFEAMNMAVVLKVPVIFVYENNHYSEHTGVDYAVGADSILDRAGAFGMKTFRADGTDFFAVYETMREVIEYCRTTKLPAAVELDTERYFGHFEGDPQRYRGPGELDRIREERDCLKTFREKVTEAKLLDGADIDAVDAEVEALIDRAVAEAKAAEKPKPEHVLEDVYISY
ncbi:thiamine pyrophosphate-dependent dehydrogenase E1 component subunit alpha [Sphingobium algorifonticola]|uniref:Thiamine pyrophosphate-dependent dehydrogenase E1 component subunit alpha n=1 Tax=Sphingobium algorifonticola TaxID=2008318 RepID=A0A437JBX9_9SPHN|nr:thiamine pyrophosphate-dependent dehydrogenase E1 component subunit alpha [Sphingobium algorifonticola]RVT43280.1 thiamine pyrophosphate-dependent dehydrogenase E1 component subunit alpha [Sphingobium algorifonticola]